MSTVSDPPTRRTPLPTNRGRRTQAAIDTAARTVIARKGILATTIADSHYFVPHWVEICIIPTLFIADMVRRAQADGYCAGDDPQLIAVAIAMLDQFCFLQLTGRTATGEPDDQACVATLANIFYRAVYYKEVR